MVKATSSCPVGGKAVQTSKSLGNYTSPPFSPFGCPSWSVVFDISAMIVGFGLLTVLRGRLVHVKEFNDLEASGMRGRAERGTSLHQPKGVLEATILMPDRFKMLQSVLVQLLIVKKAGEPCQAYQEACDRCFLFLKLLPSNCPISPVDRRISHCNFTRAVLRFISTLDIVRVSRGGAAAVRYDGVLYISSTGPCIFSIFLIAAFRYDSWGQYSYGERNLVSRGHDQIVSHPPGLPPANYLGMILPKDGATSDKERSHAAKEAQHESRTTSTTGERLRILSRSAVLSSRAAAPH